jgi:hypothetical protein
MTVPVGTDMLSPDADRDRPCVDEPIRDARGSWSAE